jgi:hypothetical protein
MTIYETNSALGWRQRAYLVKIADGAYLCVGISPFTETETYAVGCMQYDMEDYEISESSWVIEESELHGTFMFEYMKKALQEGRLNLDGANKPRDLEGLCWACSTI